MLLNYPIDDRISPNAESQVLRPMLLLLHEVIKGDLVLSFLLIIITIVLLVIHRFRWLLNRGHIVDLLVFNLSLLHDTILSGK